MNIINQLYDQKFILDYFNKKILPCYPDFKSIKKIKINGIKNNVWIHTYHVVIEYNITFATKDGKAKKLQIFCSAHSNEQRKNVYDALKFLWSKGFNRGNLTIPHPLFYSQRFRGIFYRGVKGENLYYFIRNKNKVETEKIIILTAKWLAKLHKLNIAGAKNFNKNNSLVETTIPGAKHWLNSIKERQIQYYDDIKAIFEKINATEKEFLKSTKQRWLIHGDLHPENVIKMSEKKIGVIDFTDMCLADFTRDIGSFLQQLEFMSSRHIEDKSLIAEFKKLFLETYLDAAGLKLSDGLEKRIKNYYNWTALRTVIFFLVKEHTETERAEELIELLKENLGLK